jgi:ABC-type lipoprotein release transport system permease subunit
LKPALIGFLVALMGLVITLACMNLANMLMARGANRRKELAIRLAVGASRFRLIRQIMSEGMLLSLLGGVAGFALAYGLGVLNAHFRPPLTVPEETGFYLDWRAAAFAFRGGDRVRHRIQPGARAASDESGPDACTQRGHDA